MATVACPAALSSTAYNMDAYELAHAFQTMNNPPRDDTGRPLEHDLWAERPATSGPAYGSYAGYAAAAAPASLGRSFSDSYREPVARGPHDHSPLGGAPESAYDLGLSQQYDLGAYADPYAAPLDMSAATTPSTTPLAKTEDDVVYHQAPYASSPRPSTFANVDVSTASAVAVRGAKIYRTKSSQQLIFHANPEVDRRFATVSSNVTSYVPRDRVLPDRAVGRDSLEDRYVQFVEYCNPSLPLGLDSSELRRLFRSVPRSDGHSFDIFHLYELICKFESGTIKTWTRLALELGVERTPEQSAQKVQQYAVRLKRWMRAMHIDAFFEYCMGKTHAYFNQVPEPTEVVPVRDGVPLEEDLALRALDPELRNLKSRRVADRADVTAVTDAAGRVVAAAGVYPVDSPGEDESVSPPSAKRRKRHGPAVSSAWVSSGIDSPSALSKHRGRPMSYLSSPAPAGLSPAAATPPMTSHAQIPPGLARQRLETALTARLRAAGAPISIPAVHAERLARQLSDELVQSFARFTTDPTAFAWVFGDCTNLDPVIFSVESSESALEPFAPPPAPGRALYMVSWSLSTSDFDMSFRKTLDIAA
ncbi:ARS binding protein 2-domain-containing protein [Dipodascopsis tothii]|uniref:ARS binding protein 2-domain-containing protein n=1 Tax=Dipodascopsis tothii TaxID=44089 RepID=UPI0034CFA9ED